jgi:hypothetical protein
MLDLQTTDLARRKFSELAVYTDGIELMKFGLYLGSFVESRMSIAASYEGRRGSSVYVSDVGVVDVGWTHIWKVLRICMEVKVEGGDKDTVTGPETFKSPERTLTAEGEKKNMRDSGQM